ncbi:MAG: M48 family metallopeptidase [Gallionella sp.]|nr:M48 family metallopeptidase [Gallionella sp.]
MLSARYYDGKTATAHEVDILLDGAHLFLRGSDFNVRWPLADIDISERLGNTPRRLSYANQGHCEITDHAALDELLHNSGIRHSWLDHMHHSLMWAGLAAVLIVITLLASYRYLLPWGAEVIAMRTPATVLAKMGSSTLEAMDSVMLQPSELAAARQQQLIAAYAKLKSPDAAPPDYRIIFRSSPRMGANAFALPDGSIVLLDELVAATEDDNEIMAVLAHERGHIERRHALRMVLQSSAVGLVVAWYAGDVSTLLSSVPAALLEAQYSRGMETEADQYAVSTLHLNGLSPCLLASMLNKLEAAHLPPQLEKSAAKDTDTNSALDYLSSHPATTERANLICPQH